MSFKDEIEMVRKSMNARSPFADWVTKRREESKMTVTELEVLVEQARREWEEAEDDARRAYHEYVRLCTELRAAEDAGESGPDKIPDTPSRTRANTV